MVLVVVLLVSAEPLRLCLAIAAERVDQAKWIIERKKRVRSERRMPAVAVADASGGGSETASSVGAAGVEACETVACQTSGRVKEKQRHYRSGREGKDSPPWYWV